MTGWAIALGVLFGGYFLLAGYDYGVVMLAGLSRRTEALDTLRPVLLRNEVWLVAAIGALVGAFSHAEEILLSGLYPLIAIAVAGVVAVTAGVPLSWVARGRGQRLAQAVAVAGAVAAALGWGAVLGTLFVGLPWSIGGHPNQAALFAEPMTYLGAATMLALMITHGATFLALRGQAARFGQVSAPIAAGLLAIDGGYLAVRGGQSLTALVVLCLGMAALVAVRVWLRAGRLMAAFTASTVAIAVPVVALAVTHLPLIIASSADPVTGLTIAAAASGESTLRTLTGFAIVAAPFMVASQLLSWWLFRTPAPRRPVRSGQ